MVSAVFPSFRDFPLWQNAALFAAAAVIIWLVGSRLAAYADVIAERTGLGRAFVGLLLLAGATSLPEVASTVSATVTGNPTLAVNNVLGSVVTQTAILAVADVLFGRGALTYFVPRPTMLLEGALLIVLLAIVLVGVAVADVFSLFGVSLWTALLFAAYLLMLRRLQGYDRREVWRPVDLPDDERDADAAESPGAEGTQEKYGEWSTTHLVSMFAAGSLVILVVGVTLTRVADALAVQTGLGASFVGAVLLALVTSLPELSTTIAAVRLGAYSMAVSNIFGSNAASVTLVFLADVLHRDGPVLAAVDRSATFITALGIVVTAAYLIGMIERKDRAVLRMGYDSAAVLVLYVGGLAVLYVVR